MNTYSNISSELRAYFSNHSIFKILLPIDMVLLFGGLILMALSGIFGINFGGIVNSIAYWSFILGLLLTYATMKEQFLFIGLLGYGAINVIEIIIYLFRWKTFSWGSLFAALIFGGLGYLVFKRTVSGGSSTSING